jgi:hypothetical protein
MLGTCYLQPLSFSFSSPLIIFLLAYFEPLLFLFVFMIAPPSSSLISDYSIKLSVPVVSALSGCLIPYSPFNPLASDGPTTSLLYFTAFFFFLPDRDGFIEPPSIVIV